MTKISKTQKELWKDIQGYEGIYKVSSYGRIAKILKDGSMKILKPHKNTGGYLKVLLSKEGYVKSFYIHRLVGIAFLDNPDNLSDVAHQNDNKQDNRASNLKWMSHRDNLNMGTRNDKLSKKIIQMDMDGKELFIFPSITSAAEALGLDKGNITRCCKGLSRYSHVGPYKFKYADK